MNLALAGLSYGITVVALVLLAVRTKTLIGIYKKGQPDPTRSNDKAQRLRMAAGEIFGHTKMFNFTVVGLAHWFVMVGFVVLFGTLVTAYGQLINPKFASPIIGHTPVDNLFINTGWGTGGFKATPASGWTMAHTIATGEPHELNAPFSLDRFVTGHLIDEHGAAGVAH